MKKIIVILSLFLSTNIAFADESCKEFTYKKGECEFNFPSATSGESQSSEFSNDKYSGISIARCVNGKYAIKKSVCEPKQKNTCDYVSPTTWGENNISCSHGAKELNLKEGEKQKVFSNENNGHVTYECFNGRLQGIEQQCEKNNTVFAPKAATESVCYYDTSNRVVTEYYDQEDAYNDYEANSESYTFTFNGTVISSGDCDNSECTGFTIPTKVNYNGKVYTRGNEENSNSSVSGGGSSYVETREYFYEICVEEEVQTQCTNYNTASVSNIANGYRVTKCFVNDQSDSTIEGLCSSAPGNSIYNSHTSASANGGTTYNVDCIVNTEICPPDTTKTEIGSRNEAEKSGLPNYFCEGDVCYYCKPKPEPIAELCSTCEMNSVTFTSNDNKNGSCTVNLGGEEVYSGDTKNKEFFNSIYHGQVSYFCMNGNSEVKSETCYLNCNSEEVRWGDDGNDSYYLGLDKSTACYDTISRKSKFKNKERSEVLATQDNTGNAVFYCNGYNGEWVSEEERCKLDCPAIAYWPDNTQGNLYDRVSREKGYNPFNGNRKAFACSYNFGSEQSHGRTATVSSTGMNKGSATLECKDGYWEVQSQSCNLHCDKATPARTLSKNGRTCTFNSDRPAKTAHNVVVGGYSNDDIRNNGEINWRCNNGEWDLESFTCEPKPCSDNVYWTEGTRACSDTTMSGTEGSNTGATDNNYTSYGTLANSTGSATYKCVGYDVNDMQGKWVLQSGTNDCNISYNGACTNSFYTCNTNGLRKATDRYGVNTTHPTTAYWSCAGEGIGNNDACSKPKLPARYNGVCGGDHGRLPSNSSDSPEKRCASGDYVSTGYWTWRCEGSDMDSTHVEGSDMNCAITVPSYSWDYNSWSSCSEQVCGYGTQTRSGTCRRQDGATRPDSRCGSGTFTQSCTTSSGCSWSTGSWSSWSTSCGSATRTRSASCNGPTELCPAKPATTDSSTQTSGCYWIEGSWSACNTGCGSGTQTRSVTCSGPSCNSPKPPTSQSCTNYTSCSWSYGSWSSCDAGSDNCGPGTQTRSASCPVASSYCGPSTTTRNCDLGSCCDSNQGNSCESASNSCGETNTGTIQCDGSCSASAPSDLSCEPENDCSIPGGCDGDIGGGGGGGANFCPDMPNNYDYNCCGPDGYVPASQDCP